MSLDSPVASLHRIGKSLTTRLQRLGVRTVRDLLFYFPFRYEDWRTIRPIAKLEVGAPATVRGRIDLIANKRSPRLRRLLTEMLVSDDTGSLRVVWFNQPYLARVLTVGDRILLAGRLEHDRFGVQMVQPVYEKATALAPTHVARIVPIYPLTEGVTEKQVRFLIKKALPTVTQLTDWLPEELRRQFHLAELRAAVRALHFPHSFPELTRAQYRIKFDELLLVQLKQALVKDARALVHAPAIPFNEALVRAFVGSLPFRLTDDQRKAAWDIIQDLRRSHPMNRLLNGDVGSGKTVVAAIAAYNAVCAGYQVAFMAPTEILARQHYETFSRLLDRGLPGIVVALLTSAQATASKSLRAKEGKGRGSGLKRRIFAAVRSGEIDILIGTHALIQKDVRFDHLGLAIVDEQHRFGVQQRATLVTRLVALDTARTDATIPHEPASPLRQSALSPHFLSMTATPIPRSLALTLWGDLDISIIREMPKGRRPVISKLVEPEQRARAYAFVRDQINSGRQVFVVCPLIDPSDVLGVRAAKEEYLRLQKEVFPECEVALLHGQMRPKEKEKAMEKFAAGGTHILVSTPVIEVGIDVPNATVIIIEGAERFGLAQLHQFRGRVGRGEHQSYCLLFTEVASETAKHRLQYFLESSDGFALAQKDLELRGPGELFGVSQSGFPELKYATLFDTAIIKATRAAAAMLIHDDPALTKNTRVRDEVRLWNERVHLE